MAWLPRRLPMRSPSKGSPTLSTTRNLRPIPGHVSDLCSALEIDLLAAGIFPAGTIEAAGLLKNLADIQISRPAREYLAADDAVL
jgi:hypothetical protein